MDVRHHLEIVTLEEGVDPARRDVQGSERAVEELA